jgi:hypothetical protein
MLGMSTDQASLHRGRSSGRPSIMLVLIGRKDLPVAVWTKGPLCASFYYDPSCRWRAATVHRPDLVDSGRTDGETATGSTIVWMIPPKHNGKAPRMAGFVWSY